MLTPFGIFHTVISLIAVIAGVTSFIRYRQISAGNATGQLYIWMTVFTCITGFFIFHHGGFGKPHALGILTLIVLAGAYLAGRIASRRRAARYVETIGYSFTFFLHLIPALTETATRLPSGAPLVSNPDDPGLQKAIAVCFAIFLVGACAQAYGIWSERRQRLGIGTASLR